MFTTYKTKAGDTFESIARKVCGTEHDSQAVVYANPGAAEPFAAGVELTVPAPVQAPPQDTPSGNTSEVAVLIDGQRFRFWDSVQVSQSIDSMGTVELSAPFDADSPEFRETFRPFTYKRCEVTVGGVPLFTGTMVSSPPALSPKRKSLQVSAYALPGVLNDCTCPASAFPLEFNGQNLRDIATSVAAFFGLSVVFDADPGAVFERVALTPGKKALSFLIDLAQQKGLLVSSTAPGELTFLQEADIGPPVAVLEQGAAPLVSVTPTFNPQEYYSHITGIEPVAVGLSGSQFTVKNPRLAGAVRPFTFEASDASTADIQTATEAKAGRMFASAAAYSVEVATWRDAAGELWAPNTTVSVLAPDAMIYNAYGFIVRGVRFTRVRNAETAVLDLVLPGSFSGKIPETLPWDG